MDVSQCTHVKQVFRNHAVGGKKTRATSRTLASIDVNYKKTATDSDSIWKETKFPWKLIVWWSCRLILMRQLYSSKHFTINTQRSRQILIPCSTHNRYKHAPTFESCRMTYHKFATVYHSVVNSQILLFESRNRRCELVKWLINPRAYRLQYERHR